MHLGITVCTIKKISINTCFKSKLAQIAMKHCTKYTVIIKIAASCSLNRKHSIGALQRQTCFPTQRRQKVAVIILTYCCSFCSYLLLFLTYCCSLPTVVPYCCSLPTVVPYLMLFLTYCCSLLTVVPWSLNNTNATCVIVYFFPQRQYKICIHILILISFNIIKNI